MRLNDVLTESQINELGIIDKIGSGITGAVSGYKANQAQRKGNTHSSKIIANLKSDFMKTVGGGTEPTYQNLLSFLSSHGLSDLDGIPNPSSPDVAQSAAPTEPEQSELPQPDQAQPAGPDLKAQAALKGRLKAGAGLAGKTGTGYKASRVGVPVQKLSGADAQGNPTFRTVREDVEAELSNRQIDDIISNAVKKNYARIVAAQQNRNLGSTSDTPTASADPTPNAANAFSDPEKLTKEWESYIAAGGEMNKQLQDLIAVMKSPPATNTSTDRPYVNTARTATEDVGYSRFLGISL